jgi:hypothetical protein
MHKELYHFNNNANDELKILFSPYSPNKTMVRQFDYVVGEWFDFAHQPRSRTIVL